MRTIYVDPSYPAYYDDRLFDDTNHVLNRDDTLAPFVRMRAALIQQGSSVHTADQMLTKHTVKSEVADYYSFGVLKNYRTLASYPNIRLRAFVLLEPPVVSPHMYQALPVLTAAFERVYVHNTDGDGYSLSGVDQSKLRQLFWPQPREGVLENVWHQRQRQRRIVVINGNHKPVSYQGELYSKRIEVMAELAALNAVDLYGHGWDRWWSRNSMWPPYWRNRATLMSIYKGSCSSKYQVLGGYAFALCFENMTMKGYVTEKIFDCFYAGAVPIYLGATDISSLIPQACYLDYRNYASVPQMWCHLLEMTEDEIQAMRQAGKTFLQGSRYARHHDFLQDIVISSK